MHRKPRTALVRGAVALVATLLATLGLVAFSGSSTAVTIPPLKTAKVSNAYEAAQCSFVVDAFNYQGGNLAHTSAQSQSNLLGGLVKGTLIHCDDFATTAGGTSTAIDTFNYVGTGAYLNNTRKTGVYPISYTYNTCITLTLFFYNGSQTTYPTVCTH